MEDNTLNQKRDYNSLKAQMMITVYFATYNVLPCMVCTHGPVRIIHGVM